MTGGILSNFCPVLFLKYRQISLIITEKYTHVYLRRQIHVHLYENIFDWGLLGGMSQNKKKSISLFQTSSRKIGDCWEGKFQNRKYIFLCFRQAQGRLEIVGRGCLKIYSANEDDTGTYTCRAENLLDSVDSDASLVVLGKY